MKQRFVMTMALALLMAVGVQAATYEIDLSHSSVDFKVRHMMVSKVRGSFGQFSGTVDFEPGKPGKWSTQAVIQAASIDTDDEGRDDHLRNEDFFDVQTHPTITFSSTKVERKGDDYLLHGKLTMHGVTKPIELDLEFNGTIMDPWGNERIGFSAEGKIDRRDFGITWNNTLDKGGLAVGNDVELFLEIEAIKK